MIREQIRDVDEYNQLVPLALGLVSALGRFETLVGRPLPPEVDELEVTAEEDPLLLVSLGLLSVNRTLSRWLDVVCPADERLGASEPATLREEPRDLLR